MTEENQKQIINETDQWKVVPGWTRYEVNKYGDLRNFKTKKVLKKLGNSRGYWFYICTKDEDNRQHILFS